MIEFAESFMIRQSRFAVSLGTAIAVSSMMKPVWASVPYNGTYLIIDPYDGSTGGDLDRLKTSSTAMCPGLDPLACGSAPGIISGILLKIGWCSFELFHQASYPSCHYEVGLDQNGKPIQVQNPDLMSTCSTMYDTCGNGILVTALGYISKINKTRKSRGLPLLKISIGMSAGRWTPQDVLDQVGPDMQPSYVDVPDSTGSGANQFCFRLPLPWTPDYITSFDNAFDQLTAFIANVVGVNNITILKLTGMNANDLELSVPGSAILVDAPDDPGPASVGPTLTCPDGISGAQAWLTAFQSEQAGYGTISEAFESTFGSIAGYGAALISTTFHNAELSQATVGAAAFPDIDCGVNGDSSGCTATKMGDWTGYYFWKYVADLVPPAGMPAGLARSAASAAYALATNGGALSLTAAQLSVDWTGLSADSINTLTNVECWLSNGNVNNNVTLMLDGGNVNIPGIPTVNGFQTMETQGHYCSMSGGENYSMALKNVTKNGGVYVEVETDAAYAAGGACDNDLSSITQTLTMVNAGACSY